MRTHRWIMRVPTWSALLGASGLIAWAGMSDAAPRTAVQAEQPPVAVPGPMPGDPPDIAVGPGGPAEPIPQAPPEPDLTGLIVLHQEPAAGEEARASREERRQQDLDEEFAQLRSRATGEPAPEQPVAPEPPGMGGAGPEGTEPPAAESEQPAEMQQPETPAARSEPTLPAGAWVEFTGTLEGITPEQVTIADQSGNEVVLQLDEGTIPVEQGQRVRVLHLDQGEPVRASFVVRDGERVLRTLEVLSE